MLDRAAITDTPFVLEIHRTIPTDWPGVLSMGEARGHVFQTREFMSVWAETFVPNLGLEIYFVDVRDTLGELVLQIPLSIERRGGLKRVTFADQSCADYNAPICYPTSMAWTVERAQALWAAIEAALPPVDQVLLEKMPAMVGDCVNPLFLIASEANPESAHGSDLTPPWAEIEKTQAQLKTMKRMARGLEKLGEVRFNVASDKASRDRVLAKALEQKQRRFVDTNVPGFEESPSTKQFFTKATEVFAATGNLHLGSLEVNGEIIATGWTVSIGQRIYSLMIGFEAGEWHKYSGGRILNVRFLEWAKAQGFTYFDHGIGDEPWKLENTDTHVPLGRLLAVRSAKGRRAEMKAALIARVRGTKLYKSLRPYKWIVKRALRKHAA